MPAKRSEASARPKFRRIGRSARRAALIAATLRSLRRHGHDGVSVRHIAAEADVSMGLINHHFSGSASLVAAAYASLAAQLLAARREPALDRRAPPAERLARYFAASFAPPLLDPGLFRTWLVFWSMVAHSPEMRRVRERSYRTDCATLELLLAALRRAPGVPRFRLRAATIGLAALMDGLWVEQSLDPRTFRPAEAVALCNDWVAALAQGAMPSLRALRPRA